MKIINTMAAMGLLMLIVLSTAAAKPIYWAPGPMPCPTREGTVAHAITQPDNTEVTLDGVRVVKVRAEQSPAYLVVQDSWSCSTARLIVEACPNLQLRLNQQVGVTGTLTTVDGVRRLTNCTVKGYEKNNAIVYLEINVPANEPLSLLAVYTLTTDNCPDGPAITPTDTPEAEPQYFSTVAAVKLAPDKSRVWLYNKRVVEVGSDAYGGYAVLAADGSNDLIRVYTSTPVTTLDRGWVIEGLLGTLDGARVISTDVGPHASYWLSCPRFTTFDAGAVGWAKAQPDGARIQLPEKIVIAKYPDCLYVAESSKGGIRVNTTRNVAIGRAVNIIATTATVGCERVLIPHSLELSATAPAEPTPVGMTNRSLGGGGWAVNGDGDTNGQVGVEGGIGLSTIGMLVRVWGKVTEVAEDNHSYWIDDGTGLRSSDEGGAHRGVKVSLGAGDEWLPVGSLNVGDFVAVNGVSSCWTGPGGEVNRSVRQLGAFGSRAAPWWLLNKINPVDGLNNGDAK